MSVIAKSTQVIEVLVSSPVPVRLGAISEAVGVPKSSAHRLLNELTEVGIVRRLEDGNYTPGYRLVQWGLAADRALGVREVAEPVMQRLSEDVAESVHLHLPQGTSRVCAVGVPGPQTLRPVILVGQVLPLGAGASGRLLLAYADEDVREDARRQFERHIRGAWPDDDQLTALRQRGWAISTGEVEPGLTAVSAAVLTRTGHAFGALTVTGAETRLPSERVPDVVKKVQEAARELAHAVGA